MHTLIYISEATKEITEADLKDILNTARTKNKELNITGLLFYQNGMFIQNLEGDRKDIENLLEKIVKDSRHRKCIAIYKEEIKERNFNEWSMGYEIPSEEESKEINDFINQSDFYSNKPVGENLVLTVMKRVYERNR